MKRLKLNNQWTISNGRTKISLYTFPFHQTNFPNFPTQFAAPIINHCSVSIPTSRRRRHQPESWAICSINASRAENSFTGPEIELTLGREIVVWYHRLAFVSRARFDAGKHKQGACNGCRSLFMQMAAVSL